MFNRSVSVDQIVVFVHIFGIEHKRLRRQGIVVDVTAKRQRSGRFASERGRLAECDRASVSRCISRTCLKTCQSLANDRLSVRHTQVVRACGAVIV